MINDKLQIREKRLFFLPPSALTTRINSFFIQSYMSSMADTAMVFRDGSGMLR